MRRLPLEANRQPGVRKPCAAVHLSLCSTQVCWQEIQQGIAHVQAAQVPRWSWQAAMRAVASDPQAQVSLGQSGHNSVIELGPWQPIPAHLPAASGSQSSSR
jgi:hypothetical protein